MAKEILTSQTANSPIEFCIQGPEMIEVDTEISICTNDLGKKEGCKLEIDQHGLVYGFGENGTKENVVRLEVLHQGFGVGIGVEGMVVIVTEKTPERIEALWQHGDNHLAWEATSIDTHLHGTRLVVEGHVETSEECLSFGEKQIA